MLLIFNQSTCIIPRIAPKFSILKWIFLTQNIIFPFYVLLDVDGTYGQKACPFVEPFSHLYLVQERKNKVDKKKMPQLKKDMCLIKF